ncbi:MULTISPECIES: YegP family protein [Chitinophaga]|uniref:YegP family protein n=1 Tax=Chitinophaga TaxID=79328 RepID=UPI000DB98EB5|nr:MULTISPECIES: YegP family protein [Chitinophaga]MBO9732600.1 YegP family protein [Chitinophaga sp.]MDR6570881.1 uncharacterized protein YegP (UPF0339 family) [Chitinophaga ginsengisegetis]MDR6650615.1 uncharacterized protein YegP (UPF0339 family) [Chitinophaga ginsengisegetis]MDR6656746.1 uncharacterized protein YegP (UPF0339 family) [Chitinophaga ginsengisegetis]
MGKFVIKRSQNNQYYFNLKADNGMIILSSEMYSNRAACDNGIASVKTNAVNDSRYDKLASLRGAFYFNLKAGNGQVIGTSEMYTTESARDNGINSVKANAPNAPVESEA